MGSTTNKVAGSPAAGQQVDMVRILRFFIPLGLTSMMMMMSHSIIAAGISRTYLPEISMAAYSVSLTISGIAESPMVMLRQMTLALFRGPKTFQTIRKIAFSALALVSMFLFLIAYTPFGLFVFTRLLGVPENLITPTIQVFRFVMFMSLASCIRSIYQGVLISRKHTIFITQAMIARISLMILMVYLFSRYGWVRGGYVGGITIVAGILTEGLYSMYRARKLIPTPEDRLDPEDRDITFSQGWSFYYPLFIAAVMFSLTRPIMTAGMSRSFDPAIALAAFSVATSLGWVIISPCQNVHQATMVFIREKGGFVRVRQFAFGFGVLGSIVLAAIAFTPLGTLILTRWIGVSSQMVRPVLSAMRVLSVLPVLMSSQEYYMGVLLANQHTRVVSLCKMANLLTTAAMVILISSLMPGWGSVIGAVSQVSGFGAELVVAWGSYRMMMRNGMIKFGV